MADETERLNLDSSGFVAGAQAADASAQKTDRSIDELKQRIGELLREAGALKAGLAAGTVQDEEYRQAKAKIGQELSETQRQLRGTTTATQASSAATQQAAKSTKDLGDAAEKSGDKARKGGANAAQALLTLGRGVQDYSAAGLGGVINNVEQFAASLGLGAGLAGAATVAAVAVQTLGPSIMRFLGSLSGAPVADFRTEIERLTAKIKELEERPHKSILDFDELERAKREVKALKDGLETYYALQEKRTVPERKAGQKLEEQLTEAVRGGEGFAEIEKRITDQKIRERIAADPNIRRLRADLADTEALIADINASGEDPLAAAPSIGKAERLRKEIGALEGNIDERARAETGGAFGRAFAGRDADRETLAQELDKVGRGDLAKMVRSISAASIQAEEMAKELEKRRETIRKAFDDATRDVQRGFGQAVNDQESRNRRVEQARNEREQETERRRREGTQQSRREMGMVGRQNEAVVESTLAAIGPDIQRSIMEGRAAGVDPARLESQIARQIDAFMRQAGRSDPTNRAVYSDPNRRSALAFDVFARAQEDLGKEAVGALGQGLGLQREMMSVQGMMANELRALKNEQMALRQAYRSFYQQYSQQGRTAQNRGR